MCLMIRSLAAASWASGAAILWVDRASGADTVRSGVMSVDAPIESCEVKCWRHTENQMRLLPVSMRSARRRNYPPRSTRDSREHLQFYSPNLSPTVVSPTLSKDDELRIPKRYFITSNLTVVCLRSEDSDVRSYWKCTRLRKSNQRRPC